jgi:hypothetical protein
MVSSSWSSWCGRNATAAHLGVREALGAPSDPRVRIDASESSKRPSPSVRTLAVLALGALAQLVQISASTTGLDRVRIARHAHGQSNRDRELQSVGAGSQDSQRVRVPSLAITE